MTTKSRRVEARIDPESEERIVEAARLTCQPLSAFIVRAARAEADRVLARSDVTLMPAEQFDALLGSLDEPEEAPNLARAAERVARERPFVRG